MSTNLKASKNIRTSNSNQLLLLIAIIYIVMTILLTWFSVVPHKGYFILFQRFILFCFVCIHGIRRYGWKAMTIWFCITFVISWSIETVSIQTGFPFGNYHYTELMGTKIGAVPASIMPAYFVAGYFAWTMSTIFFRNTQAHIEKRNLTRIPLVAALLMVAWDLCLDPIRSTIDKLWIWENGGSYFGVPISNFLGWLLTVFLIQQLFAWYLHIYAKKDNKKHRKSFWLFAPTLYITLALEFLLYPLTKITHNDIYWNILLCSLFIMICPAIFNMIIIKNADNNYS